MVTHIRAFTPSGAIPFGLMLNWQINGCAWLWPSCAIQYGQLYQINAIFTYLVSTFSMDNGHMVQGNRCQISVDLNPNPIPSSTHHSFRHFQFFFGNSTCEGIVRCSLHLVTRLEDPSN